MLAKEDVISMIDRLPEQQLKKVADYIRLIKDEKNHIGRGKALIAHLRGKAVSGMSTDEIMRLTRGE